MAAVNDAGTESFIAGAEVSGNVPEQWNQAVEVGINGILTDYPLELRAMLKSRRKH